MALLPRRKKQRRFRAPRFQGLFRRNSEAACFAGNRVELFRNGGEFLMALLDSCRNASSSICLEFYTFRNDAIGREFADILREAASRGVEVSVIYDYFGSIETPSAFFRMMEKEGVRCLAFNPPTFRRGLHWLDKRDHRKIVVIDGRIAFTGGLNIADEYAGFGDCRYRWRDVGMRIEGPAVAELQRLFQESWESEGGAPLDMARYLPPLAEVGEGRVLIVNGGPHHTRSFIRSAFRLAIAGATDNVRILNPYFIPGPRVIRSLLRAAAQGVKVQLVLPAISDVPLVRLVSKGFYAPLLKGGIELYERQGTVLHAKVMLIDDDWAVIGSANLDHRSFHRNYEVNVIVDSADFGRQVGEMFAADLARSRRVTMDDIARRGLLERFLEKLLTPFSRFL